MYVFFHLRTKGIIQQQAVEEEKKMYILTALICFHKDVLSSLFNVCC